MAMEKLYIVRETHTRAITALGYNPVRREILMGCEDGVIKMWEAESGKLMQTTHEHRGWITDFLWWNDQKLMLSAANDGSVVAWGPGGGVYDRISIGQPIYCMTINLKRQQLVCGVNGSIRVYDFDPDKECDHVINPKVAFIATEHKDIVRCLVCHDSRIYSAGYDQKLISYDSSFTGNVSMQVSSINENAHDAGISCLLVAKDNENNTWVITGSFDKMVKIWSTELKLVHKLDGFLQTISGICYVPRNKTVWVAGGSSYASLFDPKSGDNVSDFIGTFQTEEEEKYSLQVMKYFPEPNQVIASTSRRHMIVWKYNPSGCVTALKNKAPLETLSYTRKVPILIFSGDNSGVINKWERMQSNHFMYSKESYNISDVKKKRKKKPEEIEKEQLEQMMKQHAIEQQKKRQLKEKAMHKTVTSHYAFNKPSIPPISTHKHPNTTILKTLFVEELDMILTASEDSNIYVWGFDTNAVDALRKMKPEDSTSLVQKYAILLGENSELLPNHKNKIFTDDEDSVTNRVAGFICKYIFSEHQSCVTSMVVIGREHGYDKTYVLSAGWDSRLCIWDLEQGCLHDTFRNTDDSIPVEHVEMACDGIIIDLDYNPRDNQIAYASSDRMVYIRQFSTDGSEMKMVNTLPDKLQDGDMEITCVKWNVVTEKWVTGGEDGTIRIWSGSGFNECEQILSAQGSVSALCIDVENGGIVAGVQEIIRVYDPEHYRLVQTNVGHSDAVRSIIHIKERKQYVSGSWDKTIRIWNAWRMPAKKVTDDDKTKKRSLLDERLETGSLRSSRSNRSQRGSVSGSIVLEMDDGGELDNLMDDEGNTVRNTESQGATTPGANTTVPPTPVN